MEKIGDKTSLTAALRADVKAFAEITSAHGVGRLAASRNWIFRVIWLCLLAGAWAMICFQVATLLRYYKSYPVSTKVEIVNKPLEFPSVTICNHNAVKMSKIRDDRSLTEFIWSIHDYFSKQEYTKPVSSYTNNESYPTVAELGTSTVPPSTDNVSATNTSFYDDYWGEIPEDSDYFLDPDSYQGYDPLFKAEGEFKLRLAALTVDEMTSYSVDPYVFIMRCTIGGRDCSADDFSIHRDFDYGMCYTFPHPDKQPAGIKTFIAGPQHGLQLILNIQQKDYVPFVTPGAGVRVSIHKSPNDPYPYESGFSVEPGTETSVSMKMEHIARQPYPYGDCDKENRYPSFVGCMRNCMERLIEEMCYCTRSHYSHYKICRDETDVTCAEEAIQKLGGTSGQELCGKCTKPCSETVYRSSISSASWPSDVYEKYIRKEANEITKILHPYNANVEPLGLRNATDTRKNLLKLNIFYGELYYQLIKEEKAYEIVQLASDIGGQMGLWAGVSVLTIAELIELVMVLSQNVLNRFSPRRRDVRSATSFDSDMTELRGPSHGWVTARPQAV